MAKLDCGHDENAGCNCHGKQLSTLLNKQKQRATEERLVKEAKSILESRARWNAMGWFDRFGCMLTGRQP